MFLTFFNHPLIHKKNSSVIPGVLSFFKRDNVRCLLKIHMHCILWISHIHMFIYSFLNCNQTFIKKPIPKYVIFLTALLNLFIIRSFNFNGFAEIRFTDWYFPESWVELYFKAWWHVSYVLFSDNKTNINNNLKC